MKRFYNISTNEEKYDTDRPIHIVNCGYETFDNRNIHYKRLRSDYYFVTITSGTAVFCLNGKRYNLSKGQCFLYKPYEPQEYIFKSKNKPTNYWVHFIGKEADNLVDRLQLPSGLLDIDNSTDIFKLLNELISEYKANNPYKEEIATGHLYELLTYAARKNQTVKENDRFIKVIETIHADPFSDNETLANICHFSKAHFIRKFEERYGMSPLKYKQKVLIEQAKELLENNKSLSITKISEILGFEDNPLYFYKIFKAHTGETPKQYQERHISKKE